MKYLFLCLLTLISFNMSAQEKKTEVDFEAARSAMGMYDTYSFVDKDKGRVCILAISTEMIRGYVFDASYKLVKSLNFPRHSSRQVLVGGFFSGDTAHLLLGRDEDDDDLTHYVWSLSSDQFLFSTEDLGLRKSMFMGGLSLGDQFLFVSVKKKEDKILVYRFRSAAAPELLEFDFPASDIGQESLFKAFSKESGFGRASEVSYINDWESPSIRKLKNYCKLYYRNDSLIIVIDRELKAIRALSLDLQNRKMAAREIKRTFSIYKQEFQSSSFLLDQQLYSVICSGDGLELNIYDFYTGNLRKQFKTGRNDDILYRSTDILQGGSSFSLEGDRKLEKTRQLLRKMTNGRAIVLPRTVGDNTVELTIGSFQEMSSGGDMWFPAGGGAAGGAAMYMTGGFSREWIKSARFKSLLSTKDFEKTAGAIEKPLEERIEAFTKDIKIPEGCEGIYPIGKQLAYYYLNRKTGKLVLSSL